MDLARSLMFVPGQREKMVVKASGLTSLDLAMFDIEDGVPPGEKDAARSLLAATLPLVRSSRPRRTRTRFRRRTHPLNSRAPRRSPTQRRSS